MRQNLCLDYFAFIWTQLVEVFMWQVRYVTRQLVGFKSLWLGFRIRAYGKGLGSSFGFSGSVFRARAVVLKVVDIDPRCQLDHLRGRLIVTASNGGHWMARGSMNNCWVLQEKWSLRFKIIVNRARNANGVYHQIKQTYQISATVVWKYIRFK